jgi:two-component system, sensor histidine kinase and response regulator
MTPKGKKEIIKSANNPSLQKINLTSAEESLAKNEFDFRILAESLPQMVWITRPDGWNIYSNKQWVDYTGQSLEESYGNGWNKSYHPEDQQRAWDAWQNAIKNKTIYSINCRLRRGDGVYKWWLIRGVPVMDEHGNILKWFGTCTDIDELKTAEEELKRKNDFINTVLDNLPIGVALNEIDNGKTFYINKKFEELYGWSKQELEDVANFFKKVYPDEKYREKLLTRIMTDIQSGDSSRMHWEDCSVTHKDNSKHIVNAVNIPLFDQNTMVSTVMDITEIRKTESELINSEQRFRTVTQSANDAIITVNSEGIIINWNKGAEKIFGYSESETTGKNLTFIMPQNYAEKHIAGMKRIKQGGEQRIIGKTVELIGLHKSGKEFPIELSISEWETMEGKFYSGIIRDITERKRIESELIEEKERAESGNKLKDAFIANISHEIRTPLNGILGMARLIRDIFPGKIMKEDEELFEGMDYSSKRIIRTVDMILNYSRLQVGDFPIHPKHFELSIICKKLINELTSAAKNKSLRLAFYNNCEKSEVLADEYSITMAISSLIDNAIKFTEKGFIDIIIKNGTDNEIILEVRDTGIGMDKKYLDNIFEPYRQEQMGYGRIHQGIGLGLSIVKKVLSLNNAVINVKSEKGAGSTFSIIFPKEEQRTENKIERGPTTNNIMKTEDLRKKVVLVVEDDFLNQIAIKRYIEKMYITLITDSSDSAMEIIKRGDIDLILMDISINGSKNGLELTKELKESKEFSHIPVIAVTAHAFEKDKQRALEAGCNDYLAKPFSKESLLNIMAVYTND